MSTKKKRFGIKEYIQYLKWKKRQIKPIPYSPGVGFYIVDSHGTWFGKITR